MVSSFGDRSRFEVLGALFLLTSLGFFSVFRLIACVLELSPLDLIESFGSCWKNVGQFSLGERQTEF